MAFWLKGVAQGPKKPLKYNEKIIKKYKNIEF